MSFRWLFSLLFLFILLAWVLSFYLADPEEGFRETFRRGLLWTAVGIGLLVGWLVLERLIAWWRIRKSRLPRDAQPALRSQPPPADRAVTEDAAALSALLQEAENSLSNSPNHKGQTKRLSELPFYLVLGPEGSGKSAALQNSGMEPHLLAGQISGAAGSHSPTRVANIWLAQDRLFIDISGRIFSGPPEQLADVLRVLNPDGEPTGLARWRRLFQTDAAALPLRGVLSFTPLKDFLGSPDEARLDRAAHHMRERLEVVGDVFEARCPAYAIFSGVDSIPFFPEFFGRLTSAEAGQVFGALQAGFDGSNAQDRSWAEAQSRRLQQLFNMLYRNLSNRRIHALALEQEGHNKPRIYEFPREFKRIRSALVQFLVDAFRPHPLKTTPYLRGFFFAGVGKVERTGAPATHAGETSAGSQDTTRVFRSDATQIFRSDATQIFTGGATPVIRSLPGLAPQRSDQWLFLWDFFSTVLGQDRPVSVHIAPDARFALYRRIALGTGAGLALVLAVIWFASWTANRRLIRNVETALEESRRGASSVSRANLEALEGLRRQFVSLKEDASWTPHWGLYTGDTLLEKVRSAYFSRLKLLLLDDLNGGLAAQLKAAAAGGQTDSEVPVYDYIKTHRIISSGACTIDAPLVTKVLARVLSASGIPEKDSSSSLIQKQLDFYATTFSEEKRNPVPLGEDVSAVKAGRDYLSRSNNVDQQLRSLLEQVDRKVRPVAVAERVEGYTSVLSGPEFFPGRFTKNGRAAFEELLLKGSWGSTGESCVTGQTEQALAQPLRAQEAAQQLRSAYYRLYLQEWRQFLASVRVLGYSGPADAARKLDRLSSSASPLLGIVKLTAENTGLAAAVPQTPASVDRAAERIGNRLGLGSIINKGRQGSRAAQALDKAHESAPEYVTRVFQPASFTTPPEMNRLVSDNNNNYVNGLRLLQAQLDNLAKASATEQASVIPQARQALTQARANLNGLADRFSNVDNEGVASRLTALLTQPISLAERFVPQNVEVFAAGKRDGELRRLCAEIAPVLKKYPFSPASAEDASLSDVARVFAPGTGSIWRYQQQSLADLTVLEVKAWRQKPDAPTPTLTAALLTFLNRSQEFSIALFGQDSSRPRVEYTVRPLMTKGVGIRLVLDGKELDSTKSSLQTQFVWPAPASAEPGAAGFQKSGDLESGIGRYSGLWGVFHLFQEADPRDLKHPIVQWSRSKGQGVRAEYQPLNPAARAEIVRFPGEVDLFNPRFLEGLRCPGQAVMR